MQHDFNCLKLQKSAQALGTGRRVFVLFIGCRSMKHGKKTFKFVQVLGIGRRVVFGFYGNRTPKHSFAAISFFGNDTS